VQYLCSNYFEALKRSSWVHAEQSVSLWIGKAFFYSTPPWQQNWHWCCAYANDIQVDKIHNVVEDQYRVIWLSIWLWHINTWWRKYLVVFCAFFLTHIFLISEVHKPNSNEQVSSNSTEPAIDLGLAQF
jgi:hypothetical protein